MKNFSDRQGSNLGSKVFKVDSVVRNASGEIEEIYGKLIRNDSEGLLNEGTELNATNLTEIIKDLIEKEIDTNKCIEVANKISIFDNESDYLAVSLPVLDDELINITLLSNSSNVTIANNQISVIRETVNKEVTIIAKVTKRNAIYEKEFQINILARELTSLERVTADLNSLTVPSSVEDDFTLVTTGANGSTITWSSNKTNVISIIGGNATVYQGNVDQVAYLLAVCEFDGYSNSKSFPVTVKARTLTNLEKATSDINSLEVPSLVENNFTLVTSGANGSTITWSSNKTNVISIASGVATVYRSTVDTNVTLTAVANYNGSTANKTFNVIVKGEEQTSQITYSIDKNYIMWGVDPTEFFSDEITVTFNGGSGYVVASTIASHITLEVHNNHSNSVTIHIFELEKPDDSISTVFEINIKVYDSNGTLLGNEVCVLSYEGEL